VGAVNASFPVGDSQVAVVLTTLVEVCGQTTFGGITPSTSPSTLPKALVGAAV
jgi:hypothetical protein